MASSRKIKSKAGRVLEAGGRCASLAGSILANARKMRRKDVVKKASRGRKHG